jgi:hypothetical protein
MSSQSRLTTTSYPKRIRVTLRNQVYVHVDSAHVVNGTLHGYRRGRRRGVVDSSVRLDLLHVIHVETYG